MPSKVANGNISPCRFVKNDTTVDGKVLQAGAGAPICGVSQPGTRNAPLEGWDDGYAAIAGENIRIFGDDEICLLEMAGTVATGDPIKSDADGKGVKALTDLDEYGAFAEEASSSGKLAKVRVKPRRQLSVA